MFKVVSQFMIISALVLTGIVGIMVSDEVRSGPTVHNQSMEVSQ